MTKKIVKAKIQRAKVERNASNKRKIFENINIPLLILVIVLLIMGLLMIFSASAVIAYVNNNDTFYFFKRQIVWIVIGGVCGFLMFIASIKNIKKFGVILLIGSIILMIYMLPEALSPTRSAVEDTKYIEMPYVQTKGGATRWITLGAFDIQPAEFVKVAMIIFTAAWFTLDVQTKNKIEKWINSYNKRKPNWHLFLKFCYAIFPVLVIGLISLFVMSERDLDTIVVIVLTFIAMYYAAGENKFHSLVTRVLIIGSLVVGTAATILEPYRRARLNSFLEVLFKGEPQDKLDSGFQIWHGLIAVGSGGIFGVGYGNSIQKLFYLQDAAYTDSIFAVFAEEFGLVGTLLLIIGFIYFLSLGLQIARNSKDKFLSLVAIGATSWICIQAFLNIAANLAVIPFGGMPLPFFTYGGSNTVMLLIAIGLLLNASRESNRINGVRRLA